MISLIPYDSWDFDDSVFEFDATISEDREHSYKATRYALESGAEVSDHVIKQPSTYTISGVVSAWNAGSEEGVWTRLEDVHGKLTEYADKRQPVSVVSGTWYMDAIITKVSARREAQDSLEVEIQLQSFELATYQTVEIPPELLAESVKTGAQQEAVGGTESTQPADEEGVDSKGKTILAAGYDEGGIAAGKAAVGVLGGLSG